MKEWQRLSLGSCFAIGLAMALVLSAVSCNGSGSINLVIKYDHVQPLISDSYYDKDFSYKITAVFDVLSMNMERLWIQDVGTFKNLTLDLSVPVPSEVGSPAHWDYQFEPEELRIAQLSELYSFVEGSERLDFVLEHMQSGDPVYIWYATMDGSVDFGNGFKSIKEGWNIFDYDGRSYTSLEDVYQNYFAWKLTNW